MIDRDREPELAQRYASGENHKLAVLQESAVLEIRQLYATGSWTHQQLADKFGASKATIGQITRGETWKHVGGPAIKGHRPTNWGANHPFAKLTDVDVLMIRGARGLSAEDLADAWDVSASTIKNILAGRSWKHLL